MRAIIWIILAGVFALYITAVGVFGFAGPIATAVHFLRFAVVTTALFIYLPSLKVMFKQIPSPGRDYLLAGFIGFMISNDYFSIMNELGKIFKFDTSVFTSWQTAIGSLMVIIAAAFSIVAPGKDRTVSPYSAGAVSTCLAVMLVFVLPLYR